MEMVFLPEPVVLPRPLVLMLVEEKTVVSTSVWTAEGGVSGRWSRKGKGGRADLGVGAGAGDDAAFDGEGGAVAAGVALDDCDFAVGRDEGREGQGEGEDDVGEHVGEM